MICQPFVAGYFALNDDGIACGLFHQHGRRVGLGIHKAPGTGIGSPNEVGAFDTETGQSDAPVTVVIDGTAAVSGDNSGWILHGDLDRLTV